MKKTIKGILIGSSSFIGIIIVVALLTFCFLCLFFVVLDNEYHPPYEERGKFVLTENMRINDETLNLDLELIPAADVIFQNEDYILLERDTEEYIEIAKEISSYLMGDNAPHEWEIERILIDMDCDQIETGKRLVDIILFKKEKEQTNSFAPRTIQYESQITLSLQMIVLIGKYLLIIQFLLNPNPSSLKT